MWGDGLFVSGLKWLQVPFLGIAVVGLIEFIALRVAESVVNHWLSELDIEDRKPPSE
jgi:hypothetical protein